MMAAVPVLMVLYSSDATEIRYSDGSCLELSPCGSAMIYQERPKRGEHPKHGEGRKIQKRTQFVTSEYRARVIQALDFRNRFAERPYLCKELIGRESIVDLYAKVDNIVWPQRPEDIQIEKLPDGSRRITSHDEFATLVLSPHRHDFSISFLARVARDKIQKQDLCGQKQDLTSNINLNSRSFQQNREAKSLPELTENVAPNATKIQESCENISSLKITSIKANYQSSLTNIAKPVKSTDIFLDGNHKSLSNDQNSNHNTEVVSDEAGRDVLCCKTGIQQSSNSLYAPEDHPQNRQLDEDISQSNSNTPSNESALVVGSEHPPRFSDGAHDISSISRSSTPDGLRTLVDADSTLVQEELAQGCQQQFTALKNKDSLQSQFTSSPNNILIGIVSKQVERISCNLDISLSGSYTENNNFSSKQRRSVSESDNKLQKELDDNLNSSAPTELCRVGPLHKVDSNLLDNFKPKDTNDMLNSVDTLTTVPYASVKMESGSDNVKESDLLNNINVFQTDENSHKVRPMANLASKPCSNKATKAIQDEGYCDNQYVWTTRHCSRNDCPVVWAHPLMLAMEGQCLSDNHHTCKKKNPNFTKSSIQEKNIITKVPPTLPVTCPFQHNHKWSLGRQEVGEVERLVGSEGEFQHGMLKLVISEGVVYRLIRKPGINIVEIYPGDDSVLVSHGAKGHFFTHYVSVSGQIEERTYSIKSMPCRQQEGKYSVNKLISTAKRFLTINEIWEHRGLKEEIPCWKRKVIAVVEPLASTLLEECTVEGLGKFSAFTNGRVRVVFEDRAALDIVCNFSHRIQDCLQDKLDTQVSLPGASSVSPPMSTYESIFGSRAGRLMLPSGKFVTVNLNKPGPYRRYIEVGQEWAAWVCSSPTERHMFYTQLYAPGVLQKAAEIELKKIFCFKYVLEQTMNAQLQLKVPERLLNAESSGSHGAETGKRMHTSSVTNFCYPAVSTPLIPISDDSIRAHSHFASDLRLVESSLGHKSIDIFPPASNHDALATSANRKSVCDGGSLNWPAKTGYTITQTKEDNNLRFEQVRAVLLQNSLMITDIDTFLDNAKKSGPFENCGS